MWCTRDWSASRDATGVCTNTGTTAAANRRDITGIQQQFRELHDEGLKGIPEPILFKEDQHMYAQWKSKLLACIMGVVGRNNHDLVGWAGSQDRLNTEEDIDQAFSKLADEVNHCSKTLYAYSVSNTMEHPWSSVNTCPSENWSEAMRVFMRHYEPRTPGTKHAIVKLNINTTPPKRAEDMERSPPPTPLRLSGPFVRPPS